MKIRQGFVSNSSSSSFIASTSGTTKITLTIEVDLKQFGSVIKSKSGLDKHFADHYGISIKEILTDSDYKYDADKYRACLIAIEAGKNIIIGSFSNEGGEGIEEFLCEHGLRNITSDEVEIIDGAEGGY